MYTSKPSLATTFLEHHEKTQNHLTQADKLAILRTHENIRSHQKSRERGGARAHPRYPPKRCASMGCRFAARTYVAAPSHPAGVVQNIKTQRGRQVTPFAIPKKSQFAKDKAFKPRSSPNPTDAEVVAFKTKGHAALPIDLPGSRKFMLAKGKAI
jgi:hypothetical protein